jgi:uncharacterized membrane protein
MMVIQVMVETISFLKGHLKENFAVYFILLYTFGGRPGAILSALAVGMSALVVVPAVVILDAMQIPVFYYIYGTVSKQPIMRKLTEKSANKLARMRKSSFLRRMEHLGPAGVITIAMLPVKGCGMWSGVLMSKILGLALPKSYLLLILGSILGCVMLVGAGETLLHLIGLGE